jgi:hypothetical protein
VEVYKAKCGEIVRRFLKRNIDLPSCIAALDAALAGAIPKLTAQQIRELAPFILENNTVVMEEMARRGCVNVSKTPSTHF